MNIATISRTQTGYPALLRHIYRPPERLFYKGALPEADRPLVAIVGSRKPTAYGALVTETLARELAQVGIGVVSGLALGIDGIAHRATTAAGGYTLAVMARGLDTTYPASHRQLEREMLETGGGIISEYRAGTPPLKQHFVARNRLISGVAQATLVTEAARKSGSLITARFALEQNRLVMAVPGATTSALSVGTNELIKAGAIPVTTRDDILDALGLTAPPKPDHEPHSSDEEAVDRKSVV